MAVAKQKDIESNKYHLNVAQQHKEQWTTVLDDINNKELATFLEKAGAAMHVVAEKESIKLKSEKVLEEYQDILIPKLPVDVKPNRGFEDNHWINVAENSTVPATPPYRWSPAEQICIT